MQMRAVIFDMDGVLIDSEPFWRQAEKEVFARLGLQLSDAMCEQTMGFRIDEVVALWYRQHPWPGTSQERVALEIVERVQQLVEAGGTALPGVQKVLQLLNDHGLPLGLASSSHKSLIEAVLRRLAIADHFSATCSGQEVAHGKPDPAIFLVTAERLGVPPGACVAVEDSVAGVQAARNAGMRVIAVPAAHMRHEPGLAAAHVILGSLAEVTLPLLAGDVQ